MSSGVETDAVFVMSWNDVGMGMEDFLIGCRFDIDDDVAAIGRKP